MAQTGYINPEVAKMYGIPYSQLTPEQKAILHQDSLRRANLIKEREEEVLKNNRKAFEDEAKMEKVLVAIYKDCQKQILADVTETIAKVKQAGGDWSYANQSALTRSRGLFEQIGEEIRKLGEKEESIFTQGLSHIYTDQFLREVYGLGQVKNVTINLNKLNPTYIKKTLDYPWSGAMFSDRLWNDKGRLGQNLRIGLTQSMILGEGIPQIRDRINKGIDNSLYNAERVARTETKRVSYCAQREVWEGNGVKQLKYRCANGGDSRTCDKCFALNDKIFDLGDEPTLPIHPNCRCTYIPVTSDTFEENELNELTGSIRGAENYEKWKKAEEEKVKQRSSLSKKDQKYADLIDEINSRYNAKENEITFLQAGYDDLSKQQRDLSAVRRGLLDPEEAGFKDLAEFKAYDSKLSKDLQDMQGKIDLARKELKDIERESAYLITVGVDGVDTLEDYKILRNSLKNNPTFDYDKYGDEFVQMVARMDEDALIIHKKLATITQNNVYNYTGRGGAHYAPYDKKVNMKMSANTHERSLGNGLEGSWQTKYHEEGHQIDHLLSKVTEFADNSYQRAFTHTFNTVGQEMASAISTDILSFLNKAIDYCNTEQGCTYKPIKSLGRIPRDARYAFDKYFCHLTSNGMDSKASCQLGILTDAIGLYTSDKISRNTLSCGGWGHDSSYNKSRGKDGSTSETWATFCAIRTCGSEEEREYVKNLMPATYSCMDKTYHQLAVWLLKHDFGY